MIAESQSFDLETDTRAVDNLKVYLQKTTAHISTTNITWRNFRCDVNLLLLGEVGLVIDVIFSYDGDYSIETIL